MKTLDLRGKPCPEPVVESRRVMEEGQESFAVIVDNPASVKNITRAEGPRLEDGGRARGGLFQAGALAGSRTRAGSG